MARLIIKPRKRFFVAVEGDSEQSFVRWLQMLADARGLSIHLENAPLDGGGYHSMLKSAIQERDRQAKNKGKFRECFFIVDADRAEKPDWSLKKLRKEADKHGFTSVIQRPKHEGILYRMTPGKEKDIPTASTTMTKLRSVWSTYSKPANANALNRRYSYDDLIRVAKVDPDLMAFLLRIGLA
jgi:hypothetical protein